MVDQIGNLLTIHASSLNCSKNHGDIGLLPLFKYFAGFLSNKIGRRTSLLHLPFKGCPRRKRKITFFFSCYNINHLTLSGHSASLTRKIYSLYSNLLIFLFAIFHWKQPLFKIIDCLRHKCFYIYLFKKYFQIQSKRNFQTHSFKIVSFFKCIQIL